MTGSPKQWEYIVKNKPAKGKAGATRLPSGGNYPPYGHIGHWEVTGTVAEEMGFSPEGINILSDAAQDPDFYDFATVAAHAQTPDAADKKNANRDKIIKEAIAAYINWVDGYFQRCRQALENGKPRLALYWLGYMLHGVEDLAVHQGITNGDHASRADSPDYLATDVALSYTYTRRVLDTVRNALGQDAFDKLRNYQGDGKLSFPEKHGDSIHPHGWDIDNNAGEYFAAGKKYNKIKPRSKPVLWDREVVLTQIQEKLATYRIERNQSERNRSVQAGEVQKKGHSANPHRQFESLVPVTSQPKAEWTVLVYMAGDDSNPDGIEYAIAQDLAEIKEVGSTGSVHFIAQTDDASGKYGYRYRLRKDTDLAADRLERFNGDLNTGSTKTLVDFVCWAHEMFPAERYALVLWGHGSGHDDQSVYRALRGKVSPRVAARVAQRRLGFFNGTRRALLESGPTRGYGYDDTAGDFLDNAELRKALLQVKGILGDKLDLLGFDACLMAMIEVAYQIHDLAKLFVASERTEPGDGWWYSHAFSRLRTKPKLPAAELAKEIVNAYQESNRNVMTLSAVELAKIAGLADKLEKWTIKADPADFHDFRRAALDCSPRDSKGYCDLGSFLDAAAKGSHKGAAEARQANAVLKQAVIASCGQTSGLTIYAPGNFRPQDAGSTDALYLGLDFVRNKGWGDFLRKVYPIPPDRITRTIEDLPAPVPTYALDRHNARHVLAAVQSGSSEDWVSRLRCQILNPGQKMVAAMLKRLEEFDPSADKLKSPPVPSKIKPAHEKLRIFILPGIMGSLLHDRSGKLGRVWIDPWNLIWGKDFDALGLKWTGDRSGPAVQPVALPVRIPDADDSVQIEACGAVPIIYDRMALALMNAFGPVVEFAPYDWRQPIDYLGMGFANRIKAVVEEHPGIQIALVAHSMGGLVAAAAIARINADNHSSLDQLKALVTLGTPWLGSFAALQSLRAERRDIRLLELLGAKSDKEIENVVQTFRGLVDMLPADQDELLNPAIYSPGPLSRLAPDDPRLNSASKVFRDLPLVMQDRTCAVICTTRNTVGKIQVGADGLIDYGEPVGGDGTVTTNSATNAGKLTCREVSEDHRTLALDGRAISYTIDWIGKNVSPKHAGLSMCDWPSLSLINYPENHRGLIKHLGSDAGPTLGDLLALTGIAGNLNEPRDR